MAAPPPTFAARADPNADREALAAARKKLWALAALRPDADAELPPPTPPSTPYTYRCLSPTALTSRRRWRKLSSDWRPLTTPRAGLGVDELTKRAAAAAAL